MARINTKEAPPFPFKRPNNDTPVADAQDIGYGENSNVAEELDRFKETLTEIDTTEVLGNTSTQVSEITMPSIDVRAGNTYRLTYSGVTVGTTTITTFSTAVSNGATVVQDIKSLFDLSRVSGSFDFIASADATNLRIFVKNAAFTFKVEKVEVESVFDKLHDEIDAVSQNLEDLSEFVSEEIAGEVATLLHEEAIPVSEFSLPSVNFEVGKTYRLTYSGVTVGTTAITTFSTAINNGATTKDALKSLFDLSQASGTFDFTPSVAATNLRIFVTGSGFNFKVERIDIVSKFDLLDDKIDAVDGRVKKLETSIGYEDELHSGGTSTDTWTLPSVEVVEGETYRITYSGVTVGTTAITIFSTAVSNGVTSVQALKSLFDLTKTSGEFTFIASGNATNLRIYVTGAGFDFTFKHLTTKIAKINDELASVNALNFPYKGMRILSLGDSYTYMNYYGKYLANEMGCIIQRGRGQNGASIIHFVDNSYSNPVAGQLGHDDNYEISEAVPENFDLTLLNQYDIITIMGGTNNWGQGQSVAQIQTEVDYVIDKILTLKSDAIIFFCTQPYRCKNAIFHGGLGGYEQNAAGITLEEAMNAVRERAHHYGLRVFDFNHESGWNCYNNKVTNPEAGEPGPGNVYPPFADNIYTADGLHPRSGDGHGGEMLGRAFGRFINRNKY